MVLNRFTSVDYDVMVLDLNNLEVKGLLFELVEALREYSESSGHKYDYNMIKKAGKHNTWTFDGETPLEFETLNEDGSVSTDFIILENIPVNIGGVLAEREVLLYGMTVTVHGDIVCKARVNTSPNLEYYALER